MSPGFREVQARGVRIRAFSILLLLSFAFASVTTAAPINYEKQIKAIFAARCKSSHGVLKQEGGLPAGKLWY